MDIVRVFHQLGSSKVFYTLTGKLLYLSIAIFLVSIIYGLIGGLYLAPIDYQQKEAFRIIYVHVPSALMSMATLTFIAINSAIYLIWHIKICNILAKSSALIGAAFTVVALVTGSIWGKPMWGTWWVWDARLTSELILLFIYLGYVGLRNAIRQEDVAAKISAIFALIGFIDIPIIHYSVNWWNTLHQGATISKFAKPSIAPEMLYPLLSMILAFMALFITLVFIRSRTELLKKEFNTSWVRKIYE